MSDPLSYRMKDAARVSGIGRTKLYELIGEGKLPSVKVDGRRLILRDDLQTFLADSRERGI